MKLTRAIRDLVTQIVARDVAAGVELARSIGYSMPKDFAVGVSFVEDGEFTRIWLRLDDVSHDAIVRLPHLDGRQSLTTTDAMWKRAWVHIHGEALVLAQRWIDKHPDVRPSGEAAAKTHSILDTLKADDALFQQWITECQDRAKHFTYR
jgi:hypothetical protein